MEEDGKAYIFGYHAHDVNEATKNGTVAGLMLTTDPQGAKSGVFSTGESITGGTKVEQGQFIGKTGNTGTRPSTLGTKEESHLHWELILQKNSEEIYLGEGMAYEPLYKMLSEIFFN